MSSFKFYKIYLKVSVLHIALQNIQKGLTVYRLKKHTKVLLYIAQSRVPKVIKNNVKYRRPETKRKIPFIIIYFSVDISDY